ncbi:hypothetical protein [Kitasatospora sp. NPDC051164]|uniref:hypothetical protein n=1 Tax=Kitasatospora sp. NPDC051164 TaxID=3364055 RepID=UPI0037B22A58
MSSPAPVLLQPWQACEFESFLRTCLGESPRSQGAGRHLRRDRLHPQPVRTAADPPHRRRGLPPDRGRPPSGRARRATGAPPPRLRAAALPAVGKTPLTAVERYLVGVLTARQDPFIRPVEPLSAANGAIPFGLNITFHCGAAVCCYVAYLVPAGYSRPLGGPYPALREV